MFLLFVCPKCFIISYQFLFYSKLFSDCFEYRCKATTEVYMHWTLFCVIECTSTTACGWILCMAERLLLHVQGGGICWFLQHIYNIGYHCSGALLSTYSWKIMVFQASSATTNIFRSRKASTQIIHLNTSLLNLYIVYDIQD